MRYKKKVECPICGEKVSPQGLRGHIMWKHQAKVKVSDNDKLKEAIMDFLERGLTFDGWVEIGVRRGWAILKEAKEKPKPKIYKKRLYMEGKEIEIETSKEPLEGGKEIDFGEEGKVWIRAWLITDER